MTGTLSRRIEQLERAIPAGPPGPCFVMAPDASAAERRIEQLKAEYGARLTRTLFVMICAGAGR
jgi:hypothetical protein